MGNVKLIMWTVDCDLYQPHTVAVSEDGAKPTIFNTLSEIDKIREEINAASTAGLVTMNIYPATHHKLVVEYRIAKTS